MVTDIPNTANSIAVLDYGSQTSQLIARRVREAKVYSELFAWDSPPDKVLSIKPKGFILSGGPNSVYDIDSPTIPDFIMESGLPILGICYGMQLLAHTMGGKVNHSTKREYGDAEVKIIKENPLMPVGNLQVWMSHADRIEQPPDNFMVLASSPNSPIAAFGDFQRSWFGLQFHPEVNHTPLGGEIICRFAVNICGCEQDWTPERIISSSVEKIKAQIGDHTVLAGVSGGVDSSVASSLVQRAVGNQLSAVFVDHGLLRKNERKQVEMYFHQYLGTNFVMSDAVDRFMNALKGTTDPEQKRRIIGETFIRVFEEEARRIGKPRYLVQGTIYPDVVESSAPDRSKGQRIKSHHNVGGLPEEMAFELVEPLRYLFKDEVRLVGEALGLPRELVWRQPFPGPGLAVRCLGEITPERLACLREADDIFTSELVDAGLMSTDGEAQELPIAQAFAVLLPVRSVGVMGDQRTYQEVVALRAVTTTDFMTADWARLPQAFLSKVANRIINEVQGVNRVVYDITSKPPSTIEWE